MNIICCIFNVFNDIHLHLYCFISLYVCMITVFL